MNSPIDSPRGASPRIGLDMTLKVGLTPDVKALSVRGSRPHNLSIDSSIRKSPKSKRFNALVCYRVQGLRVRCDSLFLKDGRMGH